MIEIVAATRLPEDEFWEKSALGLSLRRLAHDNRLSPSISFGNSRGLPEIYNARIKAPDAGEHLVFMHDDVWIDDFYIADRVLEGLKAYDAIGIAGNQRRVAGQPAWAFVDAEFNWDERFYLSGSIAHGEHPFGPISAFGGAPADCELLDGVFIAAKTSALREKQVAFDPRFTFHFYDMDFCRSARKAHLRLGTWPISLTHQSDGAFGTPVWQAAYRTYLDKWQG